MKRWYQSLGNNEKRNVLVIRQVKVSVLIIRPNWILSLINQLCGIKYEYVVGSGIIVCNTDTFLIVHRCNHTLGYLSMFLCTFSIGVVQILHDFPDAFTILVFSVSP
ncbi:protein of unknown function [Candidatus Nitrosocosmicus franklandus]|uniref:Uncharacterized protein n=1 Tax=Candidatus Nitrosocosmicus franklandianus TaxID=1798806 RepID=A0A484IDW8_9ARCH|nr:protein of unknown function [Candidatus Nitrosocosmicus franklandus]